MKIREMNTAPYAGYKTDKAVRKKRKIKRRLFWLKSILAVILFSTLAVLLAMSSLFNIKAVIVQGNSHYSTDELAGSTGIVIGVNGFRQLGRDLGSIFTLRYRSAEKGILDSHPYVKDIKVRFSLPDKVKVFVTEREPFAVVLNDRTSLLVDAEGYVLEKLDDGSADYPVIKGLGFKTFQPGQALELDKPNALARVSEVLDALKRADRDSSFKLMPQLGYIDAADMKNIRIQLDSRIIVNLGDLQDLDYRVSFLKEILRSKLGADERGTLDFTNGESPEFIPEQQMGEEL